MIKGKLQSSSSNEKLKFVSAQKSFSNDNRIVPDDEEHINIHFSSDVEVDEMPIVLESVGSHDDLVTSPAMPPHNLLMVDEAKEDEVGGNFFSSEYGPIISAAQSTTILYSATELTTSLLMDTGSTNSSQTNLHGKGFANNTLYILIYSCLRDVGNSINAVIDLLLQRGADPDVSACPLPAIMYPILSSALPGVTRVARRSSRSNKVKLYTFLCSMIIHAIY